MPVRLDGCTAPGWPARSSSPARARAERPGARARRGEEPHGRRKDEARGYARQATELYEAGKLEEAFVLFRKANALYPTPQGKLYVARCHAKLGHLLLARDLYTDLAFTVPPAGASQNVRDAHAAAQTELDALRPRIPALTLVLVGGPPQGSR